MINYEKNDNGMIKIISVLLVCLTTIASGCNFESGGQTGTAIEGNLVEKQAPADETADGALILYWAEGCSHCVKVKYEIEKAGMNKQLNIISKESYGNDERYREFFARVQYCEVPVHQMGVPMLWDGENCYLGVTDILDELNKRINEINKK